MRPLVPDVAGRWRLSAPTSARSSAICSLSLVGGLARREQVAEAEEQDGGEREEQRRNQTTGHEYSKFGSCTNSVARGYPRRLYRLD